MLYKTIVTGSQDLKGESPVEILKISSKGLDKTASMQKRAAAFQEDLKDLKPMPKKAYLHVITTGASEVYGPNRNCFVAGTRVYTPTGSKAIENIGQGDVVYGGSGAKRQVTKTFVRDYTGELITLVTQDCPGVTMTADHPVLSLHKQGNKGQIKFTEAKDLQEGDLVFFPKETGESGQSSVIISLTKTSAEEPVKVYNIEVAQEHTYCVPFVVHNCDAWNQGPYDFHPPLAKEASYVCHIGEGLKKYHKTYLDGAHVYQQHKTDEEPSGIVKAAVYNENMHRGELLIQVDTDKWSARLHKKASGQDIYLSVGGNLRADYCSACGNEAHTLDQHCQHIKKQAGMTLQDGTRICMINPEPKFYDISGVNVPADTMAYVLRKVASGAPAEDAIQERYLFNTSRPPMSFSKIASTLSKLSAIEKRLICKSQDDPLFTNQKEAQDEFLHAVENYDSDQVIDQCNRKAILMSPRMFFKLIGKESPQKELFDTYADTCDCGCENLMQDMEMDPHFRGFLTDGSFDTTLPADLNLANILQAFVPDFGVSRPALNGKSIRIQIHIGKPMQNKPSKELKDKIEQKKGEKEDKESDKEEENQDIEKTASLVNDEFRRTYARYVLGFAARNNQDTCYLAMQKLARYRTVNA